MPNLAHGRHSRSGEVPNVKDVGVDGLLAQLVEDAIRLLGRNCRDQPRDVVARRLEMIFNEIVEGRARRNEWLAQFLLHAELSAALRGEIRERVLAQLRLRTNRF